MLHIITFALGFFPKKSKNQKQILKDSFWKLLKAGHPIQSDFELTKFLKEFRNESKILKVVQFTSFCRFAEVLLNGTVASSPVESINSEIST